MKRKIIQIDEEKCNGCGQCIPNCQEGALQIIDGKARLISDLFCDGLGACLGHCPEGAIGIIERDAEPYDERKVMEILATKGSNTILAHLEHLRDHNEQVFLDQAIQYIKENNIDMNPEKEMKAHSGCGCPGSREMDFRDGGRQTEDDGRQSADSSPQSAVISSQYSVDNPQPEISIAKSELRQWPVQLHLLNPNASYFKNADVVLTADCVPFAMGDYHAKYLKGKSIAIACPKLDSNKESYVEKLTAMITGARINSLNVVMMEVPCCGGLLQMALSAREKAGRNIPVKQAIISLQGEVLGEDYV